VEGLLLSCGCTEGLLATELGCADGRERELGCADGRERELGCADVRERELVLEVGEGIRVKA